MAKIQYGFSQDPELLNDYLKGGCLLTEEEGLFLAWETDPELVKAALPPCLDYVNNKVSVYVMRIGRTSFGPAFMEAALMLDASYQGKVGMYAPSFLMYGPGAESATVMGREIYGINKKYASDIRLTKNGDTCTISIERGGRLVFNTECELGKYNDEAAGMAAFGMPKKGDGGPGSAYFFTYDAHQDKETKNIIFDAVHLNDTVSVTTNTEDWIPGEVKYIEMEDSWNDPWSYFTVNKFIGAGYAHQELFMTEQIQHRNVGEPNAIMAKLVNSKFDLAAFGKSTRIINADFN
ncbi:MAG: acetoacetate decarboxylase family protein [Oscillospiraceae bacterium]|nr:acetoacetate decarboxylase family protein [Oscillospiraceae bacterium]